jgi:hypothetical protein
MMELQLFQVFQGLGHLFGFSSGQKSDGVPIPVKVEEVTVELDRVGKVTMCSEKNSWQPGEMLTCYVPFLRCSSE